MAGAGDLTGRFTDRDFGGVDDAGGDQGPDKRD